MSLVGLVFRPKWDIMGICNIYGGMYWAWTYSLFSGITIIIWIIVQQFSTPYFWLQPVYVSLGLAIIVFTWMPGVISYYRVSGHTGLSVYE